MTNPEILIKRLEEIIENSYEVSKEVDGFCKKINNKEVEPEETTISQYIVSVLGSERVMNVMVEKFKEGFTAVNRYSVDGRKPYLLQSKIYEPGEKILPHDGPIEDKNDFSYGPFSVIEEDIATHLFINVSA